MPEMTSYEHGTPSWVDVASPDVDAAVSFYEQLFGWEASEAGDPEETGGYRMLTQDGKAVAELKAGTYTLAVIDEAASHDFALQGPDGTITQITAVAFTGTKSATVTLTPGVWSYLCQPHAGQMHGSFAVS